MIRFSCPRCGSVYTCPISQGGHKTNCPKCDQRLQIPLVDKNKTVLAPPVPIPDSDDPSRHPEAIPEETAPPYPEPVPTTPWSILPLAILLLVALVAGSGIAAIALLVSTNWPPAQ